MTAWAEAQPVQPPALPETAPPELFDLETHSPGLTHTYGDGLYGTGTYGDLLPAVAPSFRPEDVPWPPEFVLLPDPVEQAPPVLVRWPPEFAPVLVVARPPEALPLNDPVAEATPVPVLKPPEFVAIPESPEVRP